MGWLSNANAEQTRAVVKKAFDARLEQMPQEKAEHRRANALIVTLQLRQRTSVTIKQTGLESIDVLPFAYLDDESSGTCFAEYVLFQEFPRDANEALVKVGVNDGVLKLLDDHTEWGMRMQAIMFAKLDEAADLIVWPRWLDEQLLGGIFDAGQNAIKKLKLADR